MNELTRRRENAVCEYHVHIAVQKGRSGRAEFTARYVGFSTSLFWSLTLAVHLHSHFLPDRHLPDPDARKGTMPKRKQVYSQSMGLVQLLVVQITEAEERPT